MSTPLRELITAVAFDESTRAAFAADPAGFLDHHGWADLDGVDVSTALGALVGELPIEQADALHSVALNADAFGGGLDGAILGLGAAASALGDPAGHEAGDPADGIDGLPVDASSDPADLDADLDVDVDADLDADVEDPALSLDGEATEREPDALAADAAEAGGGDAGPLDGEAEHAHAAEDAGRADALDELAAEAGADALFPEDADDRPAFDDFADVEDVDDVAGDDEAVDDSAFGEL